MENVLVGWPRIAIADQDRCGAGGLDFGQEGRGVIEDDRVARLYTGVLEHARVEGDALLGGVYQVGAVEAGEQVGDPPMASKEPSSQKEGPIEAVNSSYSELRLLSVSAAPGKADVTRREI